ncbi:uncharacterized protein EV422DRAFT_514430 [Fimicolochytrium jonesii]|uniref:uncharacterized protein n=1 Tax=Fimicolochytrium jonesii TaxID=1396493 RepID=UPI0022FDE10C|nr:uncharacterized protein EV422DRAFT_514430 [Fimicolochytrium jonesii]KAI8825848.1 hypothetical protein EV422DRAFT_514430 [Fimicolochytrium jonesii]
MATMEQPHKHTSETDTRPGPENAEPSSMRSEDRIAGIDDGSEEVARKPSVEEDATKDKKIFGLEKRVADLEAHIKRMTERHGRDTEIASESITKKNEQIDVMRIKINRYEFAVKEAILFLGKPMLSYEEWLNRGTLSETSSQSQTPMPPGTPGGNFKGAQLGIEGRGRSFVDNMSDISSSSPSKIQPTPAQMAEKQQLQAASNFDSFTFSAKRVATAAGMPPNFEVQMMECMRLALNYLKNAQSSVLAMIPGKAKSNEELPRLNVEGDETSTDSTTPAGGHGRGSVDSTAEINEAKMLGPPGTSTRRQSASDVGIYRRSASGELLVSGTQTPTLASKVGRSAAHERHVSAQKAAAALFHAATSLPEDDESDLATNPQRAPSAPSTPTLSGRCSNCREMQLKMHQHQNTIEALKGDINDLADQLEEERTVRERIQLSKDILDQELEELTAQLFDQANRMVVDEAKMRDELEQSNRQLRGELGEVVQNFQRRDDELRAMRTALRALENAKLRSNSVSNITGLSGLSPTSPLGSLSNLTGGGAYGNTGSLRRASARRGSVIGSPYGSNPTLAMQQMNPSLIVDGIIFSEFQDHVKEAVSSSAVNSNAAGATNFIKRCMAEDVEPCLFYSYSQESGGLFKHSAGLSTSGKRKLLENVIRGWCDIARHWSSNSTLSPHSPGNQAQVGIPRNAASGTSSHQNKPPPKAKCLTCTLTRDCEFKIRFVPPQPVSVRGSINNLSSSPSSGTLIPPTDAAWNPICRFCRDRVLAALEFFAFLAHIREGVKQGATLLGMFRQALWLRRRMAICRIGSSALFEGDVGATGYTGGGGGRFEAGGEWEKWVHILP